MTVKKFMLILTTVFLFNFGWANVLANAPVAEPQRFVDVGKDALGQFDTETLRYEKDCYRDELLLSVWIKTTELDRSDYYLNHYLFRLKDRELMLLDQIHFNSAGTIIRQISNTYDANLWTQIVPETETEKWYTSILQYAHDNDKKLKKEYKNRDKKYQENTDGGLFSYLF
ncbi:hypothetical protein SOV_38490 [Sporomusa ovata DSM 2662]|uniref:Uncharacterized protein n=2 Tax=Sporomusa ovata TaxID=2378 RepID=A0A0U1KUG5_9FIRM|nr:hypothetical protein SOV_3c01120 [Sporomusa ovata DSM 2662]CQR70314.1 hypothetical protein SpAn4DRAFT_1283 [Sporomusa ovata]